MTLKWDLEKYIQLLKENNQEDNYNPELFFYENYIQAWFKGNECQKYSTMLHSFLANEIDIDRLRFKYISLRGYHVRLTDKTIKKIKNSIDLSLSSEELDLPIEWNPEFQILSDKIDYLYDLIEDNTYYLIYERSKYANKISPTIFLQAMILEHIAIFKKLS